MFKLLVLSLYILISQIQAQCPRFSGQYIVCTSQCTDCNINCLTQDSCKDRIILSGALNTNVLFQGKASGDNTDIFIGRGAIANGLGVANARNILRSLGLRFRNFRVNTNNNLIRANGEDSFKQGTLVVSNSNGRTQLNCLEKAACADTTQSYNRINNLLVTTNAAFNRGNEDRLKASSITVNQVTSGVINCGRRNNFKNCEDVTLNNVDDSNVQCRGQCPVGGLTGSAMNIDDTPVNDVNNDSEKNNNNNGNGISKNGIIIGVFIALIVLSILIWFGIFYKKKQLKNNTNMVNKNIDNNNDKIKMENIDDSSIVKPDNNTNTNNKGEIIV